MSKRIFWTLLFVGVCIAWLVLSYRPQILADKEVIFGPRAEIYFAWLFAGSAVLFVLIQGVLVAGVRGFPTRIARSEKGDNEFVPTSHRDIHIHPGAELFWTALPLLISLGLFWAIWQSLPGR